MLPPPTTSASSTPERRTSAISAAICSTVSGSIPYSCLPISASPESFSRTRRNTLRPGTGDALCLVSTLAIRELSQSEPLELDHLEPGLLQRLADGLVRVVDPLLVDERRVGVPLVQPPLDDLLP